MAEVDLNGEIREIREALGGIRSDIKCLPEMRKDINALGKHYAALAEKMKHPCGDHTEVVERIAQLEASGQHASSTARTWLTGIAIAASCLTAILIAVLT